MSETQQLFKSQSLGGGRRKYGKLTLQQKVEIIKAAELGLSQRALASQYNCGKTQIHLLVTQKQMWLDKWERSKQYGKYSASSVDVSNEANPQSAANDLIYDFYIKLTAAGIPVTGAMLQERAIQIAKELQLPELIADSEWLQDFVENYGIDLSENSDNGNLKLLQSIGKKMKNDTFLQRYDPCDIYNLSEVHLAYKFVPNDDTTFKPRSAKDFLTVSLCYNAVGAKETEVVVYDSSQHGEISTSVYSQCVSNWKGIMTHSLYEKLVIQLNADMARQNRRILLLVDESKYSGSLECTMSNVNVKSTSICLQSQPMLCGISHMFKFLYYRNLLRVLLAHLPPQENVDELAEKLPLNKAVRLIQSAWDEVHPRTIQNSFTEAGLKHHKQVTNDSNLLDNDEALILEIKQLISFVRKRDIADDLCDDYFSSLLSEDVCSNSTSDCSDSEEDVSDKSADMNNHIKHHKDTNSEKHLACLGNELYNENFVGADINSVISDALPSIAKLDYVASTICDKNKLQRAKKLLNDLEDLFEDIITDYKYRKVQESSES